MFTAAAAFAVSVAVATIVVAVPRIKPSGESLLATGIAVSTAEPHENHRSLPPPRERRHC